jgi:hypothetical protein
MRERRCRIIRRIGFAVALFALFAFCLSSQGSFFQRSSSVLTTSVYILQPKEAVSAYRLVYNELRAQTHVQCKCSFPAAMRPRFSF